MLRPELASSDNPPTLLAWVPKDLTLHGGSGGQDIHTSQSSWFRVNQAECAWPHRTSDGQPELREQTDSTEYEWQYNCDVPCGSAQAFQLQSSGRVAKMDMRFRKASGLAHKGDDSVYVWWDTALRHHTYQKSLLVADTLSRAPSITLKSIDTSLQLEIAVIQSLLRSSWRRLDYTNRRMRSANKCWLNVGGLRNKHLRDPSNSTICRTLDQ